jgi:hypothetical protein
MCFLSKFSLLSDYEVSRLNDRDSSNYIGTLLCVSLLNTVILYTLSISIAVIEMMTIYSYDLTSPTIADLMIFMGCTCVNVVILCSIYYVFDVPDIMDFSRQLDIVNREETNEYEWIEIRHNIREKIDNARRFRFRT